MVSCDMIRTILKMRPKMALIDPSPLMKLHRKIENNKKVCRAQEFGSHIQGQGHNHGSEVKSFLCDYFKLAEANFVKLSRKVNHN